MLSPAKPLPEPPEQPERNDWRVRLYAGTRTQRDKRKLARIQRLYPPGTWMSATHKTLFMKRMAKEGKLALEPAVEVDQKPRPAVTTEGGDKQAENTAQTERMFPERETDGQGFGVEPSDDVPF